MFRARWTVEIEEEWRRNLLINRPDLDPAKLERLIEQMRKAIPDCLVTGPQALVAGLTLPDRDGRHVLAAGIAGQSVTFNLKDFRGAALLPFGVEAIHPDDFVLNQLSLSQLAGLRAIKAMRIRLRRPPMTAAELLEVLERSQLPRTAAWLRQAADLI